MAQSITARGTSSSKADTTSLAVNDVDVVAGQTLYVGVIFFAAAGNPEVKYGNKVLKRDKTNEHVTAAFRTQLYKVRIKTTKTGIDALNAVCTWGTSTPGARAMDVFVVDEGSVNHLSVVNDNTASTTPNTSSAGTSTIASTISIALFGANGPIDDTAPTANLGHTLLQRDGTTGGAAATNLTLQSTHEILTAVGVIRASLTATTARDWANLIVAYVSADTYTITNTYHRPWKTYPGADVAIFEVENSSSVRIDDILIPRGLAELITDAQITEYITNEGVRTADIVQAENELEQADSTFETRLATFENDTITV